MSTMQFISKIVPPVISLLWLIFLFWVIWHFKTEISELLKTLPKRVSKITAGPVTVEMTPEQNLTVHALSQTIKRGLLSESLEDRKKIVKEDLPKLKKVLSPSRQVGGIESAAIWKLRLICKEVKDPKEWINDDIFVSGTYGHNVWPAEMAVMLRNGWIELSKAKDKVRITEEGRRFAQSSQKTAKFR